MIELNLLKDDFTMINENKVDEQNPVINWVVMILTFIVVYSIFS